MALGELLIAVAWSDGVLEPAERDRLADLLFRIPEMTPEGWQRLREQAEQPVGDEERAQRLVAVRSLAEATGSEDWVVRFLEELSAEDGPFGEADRALAGELADELRAPREGFFDRLAQSIRKSLRVVAGPVSGQDTQAPAALRGRLDEDDLHRLRTMGGLLARVVQAKGHADRRELNRIREILSQHGDLDEAESDWVLELVVEEADAALDAYALCRDFFEHSDEAQRIRLLDLLFEVAYADGEANDYEVQEIRKIRSGLLLSQRHFSDAKVRASQKWQQ